MDTDGRVPQDRLWPGGGDGDEVVGAAARHGVFEVEELAVWVFKGVFWCVCVCVCRGLFWGGWLHI